MKRQDSQLTGRLTLFLLLTVGREERSKAVAFTSGNSRTQTYLLAQVDGVALAHAIPAVTRKTVAGNLEGEEMLTWELGPPHTTAELDGKHVVWHPLLHLRMTMLVPTTDIT